MNSVVICVADRWLGYGPTGIRIRHRTVAQVNHPVHAGWACDVQVVGRQTLLKAALIEISQYELERIFRQSVKFLCHVTNMLGGSIHVGSGLYVNNSHKQLRTFARWIQWPQ